MKEDTKVTYKRAAHNKLLQIPTIDHPINNKENFARQMIVHLAHVGLWMYKHYLNMINAKGMKEKEKWGLSERA